MTMLATIGVGDMFVSVHAIQAFDEQGHRIIHELHFLDITDGTHQTVPCEGEMHAFKLLAAWIMMGESVDYSLKPYRYTLYNVLGDGGAFLPFRKHLK